MKKLIILFVASTFACSGGSGSGTLYVEVFSEGKPDSTDIEVVVRRAGEQLTGVNVFVEDASGANAARSLEEGGRKYSGRFPNYVAAMTLKITAGPDELSAGLEGPPAHLIVNPPSGAIVMRGDADVLTVKWTADAAADRVIVDPDDLDAIAVEGDPGEYALPLAGLKDGDQKIRVVRENSLDLAGGVMGSKWRAQYRVDNRFTLKR